MFLIGVVAAWASCAMALVETNRQADNERTDAATGKIFTAKLHQ
jgi:hypothetical protein